MIYTFLSSKLNFIPYFGNRTAICSMIFLTASANISILQNRYLFLLLFQLCLYPLKAQINGGILQTEVNNDAINLVNDIFIKGTCKNISNIESSGAPESIGVFQNGGDIIGFSDGIILSTGDVKSAEGPNNFIETTTQFNRPSEDRHLMEIATHELFDVTVLEFDFVPIESEVTFQYVFASEEYCEFVGTIFNDVFGFFVSGPGINGPFADGAVNVARLPNSQEFVSINTVNHRTNQNIYVKNELRDDVGNCDIIFNPSQPLTIEFDGFTIPLLARIRVIPCETYHIRLIVGDVGDDKLDSAVFLRSKSFDLGESATVKTIIPNRTDTVAYENCIDGQFVFTRPNGNFNLRPLEVNFEIDESSTALEGIDFATIPRSVTIPAGQDTVVLSIPTLLDEQEENIENITLNLNFLEFCGCKETSSATLNIADTRPPAILFTPISACVDQSVSLVPKITGGIPPYNFKWNDNSTDMSLQTSIQTSTKFVLTVTDFCDNQRTDSIQINLQEMPTAVLSGDVNYCEGLNDLTLPLNFGGNPPWSFTYQINNNLPITIDSILDNNFNLPISEFGNYQLIEFRDAACMGDAIGTALVNNINIDIELETIALSCPDANDGQINLNILAANFPNEINWSPRVNDATNPTNLSAGVYHLMIRDAQNCIFIDSIIIENPNIIAPECEDNKVYIPTVFSPNGDGLNDFFEIFLADKTTVQQILKVEVLDRWGNLVYFSEGVMPKWDGRFQGEMSNPAVFFYTIQLELNDGKTELLQGSLNLVR